jgi:hypothetical protein
MQHPDIADFQLLSAPAACANTKEERSKFRPPSIFPTSITVIKSLPGRRPIHRFLSKADKARDLIP